MEVPVVAREDERVSTWEKSLASLVASIIVSGFRFALGISHMIYRILFSLA